MNLSLCSISAITGFLKDIDIPDSQIAIIVTKLERAYSVYLSKKPSTSVGEILLDLYKCGQKEYVQLIQELIDIIVLYQIYISLILVFVIIIIICLFIFTTGTFLAIGVVITSFIGAALIYYLYESSRAAVLDVIGKQTKNIDLCITKSELDFTNYETQERNAISSALCSY